MSLYRVLYSIKIFALLVFEVQACSNLSGHFVGTFSVISIFGQNVFTYKDMMDQEGHLLFCSKNLIGPFSSAGGSRGSL